MAKVKGPLLSISARGQIAKSLVFLSWKGLDTVRKYVIPANPKSADQQTQRGYFSDAIDAWHTDGYNTLDVAAWNLFATAQKAVASGYNMFVKYYIAAKVATQTWTKLTKYTITNITATGAIIIINVASDKTGKLYIGTKMTSMHAEYAGTFNEDKYEFSITGLTQLTKYYLYIANTAEGEAARTGIYSFTTLAS